WPISPGAAPAAPARRAASLVPRAADEGSPMSSSSTPRPAVVHVDGPTLIRNIERALVSVDADERERALSNDLSALIAIDAKSAGAIVKRTEPGPVREVLRARVARLRAAADLN